MRNETFTFGQIKKHPKRASFVEAMISEINDHEERDHWELIDRNSMPKGHRTIMSILSFKIKRYPDGRIMKYKARLCAHGGQQKLGVNYWDTYSLVVNWISVRLLLIFCCVLGLESQSIDFVLAFPQAELEEKNFFGISSRF